MENTVLDNDVLSIINVYKTSYDKFEEHQKRTEKLRDEVSRFFKLIQNNTRENVNTGSFILSWIENERIAKYQEIDDFEFDYGENQ